MASAQASNKDTKPTTETKPAETPAVEKKPAALEEDDEFEDFPVDDWEVEDTTETATEGDGNQHLWEESWDDDDTSDDFSAQLKEELKKVESSKRK